MIVHTEILGKFFQWKEAFDSFQVKARRNSFKFKNTLKNLIVEQHLWENI